MIEVRTFLESHSLEWDAYVRRSKEASCYHLWGWREVLASRLGHTPYYLGAWRDERVCGILPLIRLKIPLGGNNLFSLPFVNYGGVVADDPEARDALLNEAIRLAGVLGSGRIELRHRSSEVCIWSQRTHRVRMVLPLPESTQALWNMIRGKLRNQVRKADHVGLKVACGGEVLLPGFYEVFAANMRELGSPVWSSSFFRSVLRRFPERTRIYLVSYGTLPIAAGLILRFKNSVEIPWASSLRPYNHLCANVRMYWQMLVDAVEQGYEVFDFGRSAPDGSHYRFKRQWGAFPEQICWHYWPGSPPEEQGLEGHRQQLATTWRWLPSWTTRAVGPVIRRWLPQ